MGKDAAGAASDEETGRNIYIFRHIVRVGCIGYGAAFPAIFRGFLTLKLI